MKKLLLKEKNRWWMVSCLLVFFTIVGGRLFAFSPPLSSLDIMRATIGSTNIKTQQTSAQRSTVRKKYIPPKRRRRVVRRAPFVIDTLHKTTQEVLQHFFKHYLPDNKFSGAIMVARDHDVIYERYTGWANKEKMQPVTANTPFHVASVSKTFTASAILKLVQDGKLRLEDKVVKYIPYFVYDDVEVIDLLTHRSGLRTYDKFMRAIFKGSQVDSFLSNEQVVKAINEHPNQKFAQADKHFFYSNSNYAILALIIEELTGVSYKQFMEEQIFKPLGLHNSYVFSLEDTARYTPSYNVAAQRERYRFLDAVVGDKGIYTSATDLLKWDSVLNEGKFLHPDVLARAFHPYSAERSERHNYGLGWRLDTVAKFDKKIVYHFGWWHGNRSVFIRDLTNSATVIILSNKFNKNIYRVKDLVTEYDIL